MRIWDTKEVDPVQSVDGGYDQRKNYEVGRSDLSKTERSERSDLSIFDLIWFIIKEGDNIKLSQSEAILRHLGRKFALDGKNDEEKMAVDQLHGWVNCSKYLLPLRP